MRRTSALAACCLLAAALTALAPAPAAAAAPALPWDFNGDDFADVAVGAPGEDIKGHANAGNVTVLRGTEDGVTTTGARAFSQATQGVPGGVEDGDRFGASLASGDIDGDGFADLVAGVPGESRGGVSRAGSIAVFFGAPGGLTAAETRRAPAPGQRHRFGTSVGVGDLDGDGFDDVVAGAPGGEHVVVFPGSAAGLHGTGFVWSQASQGVPGGRHRGELFGYALAVGDVDADGRDDLAVGAPFDRNGDQADPNGSVTLLRGSAASPSGLTATGAQRWHRGSPGVGGKPHRAGGTNRPDSFGFAVSLGHLDADGFADLVVGAPGTPAKHEGDRRQDAGALNMLRGSAAGLTTVDQQFITQSSAGIPGRPRVDAYWGQSVATADVNADGRGEVATGAPGRNFVTVLVANAGQLGAGDDQFWSQDSAGVAGHKEKEDRFGAGVRFAAILGFGNELLIGAPGENRARGAFTLLVATGSGLSAGGSRNFTQDSNNVPGRAERGDAFGML